MSTETELPADKSSVELMILGSLPNFFNLGDIDNLGWFSQKKLGDLPETELPAEKSWVELIILGGLPNFQSWVELTILGDLPNFWT